MDDGSGSSPYEILSQTRDWLGFIGNIAMGATLASYFSTSGLKGTQLLDDLIDNADTYDWDGEN